MGIMSGNHDWNMDGKIDWLDDALFHEEIYNNGDSGGSSGGSGGDNGGCAGCLSSIIAGILVFIVLAMLFGH
jgi:hypothetical protein